LKIGVPSPAFFEGPPTRRPISAALESLPAQLMLSIPGLARRRTSRYHFDLGVERGSVMAFELTALLVGALIIAALGAGFFYWHAGRAKRNIQHDFNKVFMLTTPQAREAMITDIQKRHGCNRVEAMRRAVAQWRQETRSWK
jgi:Flp pilus assembly protein TadB